MPSTLIDTCTLCGLRFSNRPLLELHIREDHRRPPAHRKNRPDGEDDGGSPGDQPESPQATE
jgi:hypothetical protein